MNLDEVGELYEAEEERPAPALRGGFCVSGAVKPHEIRRGIASRDRNS